MSICFVLNNQVIHIVLAKEVKYYEQLIRNSHTANNYSYLRKTLHYSLTLLK